MSRYIPIIIITAIILFIDVYAFQSIRTVTAHSTITVKRASYIAYWLITCCTLGLIYYAFFFDFFSLPKAIRVIGAGILLCFFIPKLFMVVVLIIDDLIRGVQWIASFFIPNKNEKSHSVGRSVFLSQFALLLGGFLSFQMLYGMFKTAWSFQWRRYNVPVKDLASEWNNLKIVQISDIHSGTFTRKSPLIDLVNKINAEQADLILFTGDLVNNRSDEVLDYTDVFGKLKARLGIFSVLGNHDYGDYYSWPSETAKQQNMKALEDIEQQMGWKLLRNEHVILNGNESNLAIIGVENWSALPRFSRYGDLKKAYAGSEGATTKILMSHDPTHWDAEVNTDYNDIQLTLSGHTHGFQFGFEIPGLRWSPSQYVYDEWAGLYQKGDQYLYVNRGLGCLAYPGRVGIPPEVTVITLKKAT